MYSGVFWEYSLPYVYAFTEGGAILGSERTRTKCLSFGAVRCGTQKPEHMCFLFYFEKRGSVHVTQHINPGAALP